MKIFRRVFILYGFLLNLIFSSELTGGVARRYLHNSPIYKNVVALFFLQMVQKFEAENFLHSTKDAPETDKATVFFLVLLTLPTQFFEKWKKKIKEIFFSNFIFIFPSDLCQYSTGFRFVFSTTAS